MLADLGRTGSPRAAVRCACGLLGCLAMVGAASFGMTQPAAADEPRPRRTMPADCRLAMRSGDWHTWRKCRAAWRAMYQDRRGLEARPRERRRKAPPKPRPRSEPDERPSPRRIVTAPPSTVPPAPPPVTAIPTQNLARESAGTGTLRPLLLLGLLLPAAVAIGYPMRHRFYAMAGPPLVVPGPLPFQHMGAFGYRPAIDPFAVPLLALSGAGAAATARVIALAALEDCGDSTLVIVPRPDTGALFGLAEDDLLDDTGAGLFIPGNLDAALAYLETELAIRRDAGAAPARRLLLVADCAKDADRIGELLARHPGAFTALLLGDWPGDHVTVDEEGLPEAPPALSGVLPERLPAMSRTEARDRLFATIRLQRSPRAEPPRRSRARRR
ncbi:hypothetical protein [Actinomadura sp. 9N407]|uniref:hypothetical protein n=1 Tax=Actinomadura sp. 9N407 TaxID=3375154 RepID=UPI0037991712